MQSLRLLTTRSASAAALAYGNNVSCTQNQESGARSRPVRVLVTGFHDWKELGGNVWRCRDNPSCRLIYGAACQTPPVHRRGPLVSALAAQRLDATFDYVTLPTLWSTAAGLDLVAYDVVIHLGLGVYDSHTTLLLELGAYNERRGDDALYNRSGHTIDAGGATILEPPPALARRITALEGTTLAGFRIAVAPARPENSFICNETHHRALRALALPPPEPLSSPQPQPALPPCLGGEPEARGGIREQRVAEDGGNRRGAPRGVYFVHLPYPAKGDEAHVRLGAGVAALIGVLVGMHIREEERGEG
jgi:hypothetical protein